MKKKIIGAMIFCAIAAQGMTFAAYTTIYERQSLPVEIADGVTQTQIEKFTEDGWININLVEVDLTQGSQMTVVTDSFLKERDKLSNLIAGSEEADDVVAAINSDFFDTANNTTMGTLIKSGEVLSTSVGLNEFASFNIAKNGLPFIGYINSPKNTFTNGTAKTSITYINKPYLNYNRTILYTSKWAASSYGNTAGMDIFEMLVVDGVVKATRLNGAPFVIPENGYVLASVGSNISEVSNNYCVGDTITINYDMNFKNIELAIGGGAQIVVKGSIPTTFSQNITGKNPRTALGINKDRTKIYMVTIDGRTTSYRGVTQTELAEIMLSLGAYEAINLDGGGSSEMMVKTPLDESIEIINSPSDGSERNMYTGLAVVKQTDDNPTVKSIQIKDSFDILLLGQNYPLTLTAIDTNYELSDIESSEITWTFDGIEGKLENGSFTPYEAGEVTVTANYQDLTASKTFTVHDDVVAITVSPSALKLTEGESKQLTFYVKTSDGTEIEMSPELLSMLVPESLGSYDLETHTFTASDDNQQGYFSVGFKDLVTYVPVAIGTEKALLFDFEPSETNDEPAYFMSYPESVTGRYKTMQFAKNGEAAGMISYDFTTTTETRAAYMTFANPIVLPENTESVGMWVFGRYGKNHWLRGKIVDADGVSTNITFARNVNWSSWQYVSAELPEGLKAPFVLERVYLVETDPLLQDEGTIVIDDIYAVIGQTIDIDVPENISREVSLDEKTINAEDGEMLHVAYIDDATDEAVRNIKQTDADYTVDLTKTGTGFKIISDQNMWLMTFNNKDGSIRLNGVSQWTAFLSQKDTLIGKPVVVMMQDQETFKDSLEGELLYEQLGALVKNGLDVTVVYPTSGDYSMRMVSGVTVLQLPISEDTVMQYKFYAEGTDLLYEKN